MNLIPLHEIGENDSIGQMADALREEGWQWAPIVIATIGGKSFCLSGSKRFAAAKMAGIEPEVIELSELCDNCGDAGCCEEFYSAMGEVADRDWAYAKDAMLAAGIESDEQIAAGWICKDMGIDFIA